MRSARGPGLAVIAAACAALSSCVAACSSSASLARCVVHPRHEIQMFTGDRPEHHLVMVVGQLRQLHVSKERAMSYRLVGPTSQHSAVVSVTSVACPGGGHIAVLRAVAAGTSTVKAELASIGPGNRPGMEWFAHVRVRHR